MSNSVSVAWKPIEDLPDNYGTLASPELPTLANVWQEQHELLSHGNALREFNEKLQREWAIETGIIERVYSLDRGITQLLIEKGIDASLIPYFPHFADRISYRGWSRSLSGRVGRGRYTEQAEDLLLEVGEFGVERLDKTPAAKQIVPPQVAEKIQHAVGGWGPTEAVLRI